MAVAASVGLHAASAADVTVCNGNVTFAQPTPWGDIAITFEKCMANELYTFRSVSVDGRELNHTESDNIGPFGIQGKGWSGGNHLNGGRRSAFTETVDIFVDGHRVTADTVMAGTVLTVEVVNRLLNPADDTDFALERMVYSVSGNTIDVEASHEFLCDSEETVERYYGMQSMFVGEHETLTPGGKYAQWTSYPQTNTGNELQFTKASAPGFTTFVEHSDRGYQASHLTREGIGDRRFVADGDVVFIGNSWTKSYHKTMGMHTVKKGDRTCWHGLYSWFDAPVGDHTAAGGSFDYGAYIAGQPYLFSVEPTGELRRIPLNLPPAPLRHISGRTDMGMKKG